MNTYNTFFFPLFFSSSNYNLNEYVFVYSNFFFFTSNWVSFVYCKVSIYGPNLNIGMLAQWAQDYKFVENEFENWALVNLDNSYHVFKDNLNWTSNTNRNRFPVQGASHSYKLVLTEYNYKLDCYSLFSRISPIPFS